MLIPLTREKMEELLPLVATGAQYKYCWGKLADLLRRVSFSFAGGFVVLFLNVILGREWKFLNIILGIIVASYWLWGPVFLASRRNRLYRRYAYCGFWRGEVLDTYYSDVVVNTRETVDRRGRLLIKENLQRFLNLEVGDDTGFVSSLKVPRKPLYKVVKPGLVAEMLVLSNTPDLSRIAQVSDIYLPDRDLWISDYPVVRRDLFVSLSRSLGSSSPWRT